MMNDRIKTLAISTGIYDSITDPWDKHKTGDPYSSVMDDLEKFAELLVQDCANWIRNNYDHESAEPLAFYMEMYYGLHGDYA